MLIEIYLAQWNFENNQYLITDNNCENNIATQETVKDNCQKKPSMIKTAKICKLLLGKNSPK